MAKKQPVKKVSSTMKNLLNFRLMEDHIEEGGAYIFFLRVHPPNMVILSKSERRAKAHKFQEALDGIDIPFDIFVMDKAEDLEHVKKYYQACRSKWPDYDFVFNAVLRKLDTIDGESASIQRAFYIVVRVRDRQRFDLFAQQFQNRLDFTLAKHEELETVMRNFLLREYVATPVYSVQREMARTRDGGQINIRLTRERQAQYEAGAANESLLRATGRGMQAAPTQAPAGPEKQSAGKEGVNSVRNNDESSESTGTGRTSGGLWPHR